MELKDYQFPTITALNIAFSTTTTDPILLKEAKDRGFYNGRSPYNTLFSNLFFSGGTLKYKPGLDKEFLQKASNYMKSLMMSFEPKHEEKEAVCAFILSEIAEV